MEHELKVHARFFAALAAERKPFEVRRDDREPPYRVGDVLRLREYLLPTMGGGAMWVGECSAYTGREVRRRVTYVLRHADFPEGVPDGWCVLGLGEEG
jgi:hypothetical protein